MDWLDIKEFIRDAIKYIITFVVILVIVIYVVSLQQIVGSSMKETLADGDVVILNKLKYHFFEVSRFNVISFSYNDTKYLVKRVIGLPGDTIKYEDGILYINDEPFDDPYNKDSQTDDFYLTDYGYQIIPEDMYFVMGDNRGDSLDSRKLGLIQKKDIIGKVEIRIWPMTKFRIK